MEIVALQYTSFKSNRQLLFKQVKESNIIMTRFFQVVLFLFAATGVAQSDDFSKLQKFANGDPTLMPEYGNIEKTREQQDFDTQFLTQLLEEYDGDKTKAGKKMIDLGFQYLYQHGDLKTAMRRFNQAFLVDSANADIYYGYGTVYFFLGAIDAARKQFDKGLQIQPGHYQMLTDYGITYLADFYNFPDYEVSILDRGLSKLIESYNINPNYASTTHKLSIFYLYKNDCDNSQKYLKQTEKIDKSVISEDYLNDFNVICRDKALDCSKIRTGKFRIVDEVSGISIITRTDNYQIEESKENNFKLKLAITWLDDCTYQLKPVEDLINPEAELPEMVLTCYITEVNKDSYMQVSEADLYPIRLSKEVEIIE